MTIVALIFNPFEELDVNADLRREDFALMDEFGHSSNILELISN